MTAKESKPVKVRYDGKEAMVQATAGKVVALGSTLTAGQQ